MSRSVSRRSSPRRPPIRATPCEHLLAQQPARPLEPLLGRSGRSGGDRAPRGRSGIDARRGGGRGRVSRPRGAARRSCRRARAGAAGSRSRCSAAPRASSSARRGMPRRSISRAEEHVRLEAVAARLPRPGAARRSARSVRAPRAAPAATRSPRPAPTTRSSLRLRATWITRARSTWRSSIGGRASARTTAAASCGSTSRRIHASTSRTSARLRKPSGVAFGGGPRARAPAAQCAIFEPDTCLRIRPGRWPRKRSPRGLRSVVDLDRLGRRAADRRADRRLAAVRRRARRSGRAARARLRRARQRLQRAAAPGELPPLEARRPPGLDRGEPAARCARCSGR